jgi:hypothetical protein
LLPGEVIEENPEIDESSTLGSSKLPDVSSKLSEAKLITPLPDEIIQDNPEIVEKSSVSTSGSLKEPSPKKPKQQKIDKPKIPEENVESVKPQEILPKIPDVVATAHKTIYVPPLNPQTSIFEQPPVSEGQQPRPQALALTQHVISAPDPVDDGQYTSTIYQSAADIIKGEYDIFVDTKIKVQTSNYGKGDMFKKYSDLRGSWINTKVKDWKSLRGFVEEFDRREAVKELTSEQVRSKTHLASVRKYIINKQWNIIKELSEEGSEFYQEQSRFVEKGNFYSKLDNEDFTINKYRYKNLEKLKSYQRDSEKIVDLVKAVKFEYLDDIRRFALTINDTNVTEVYLSDQICYVLGFDVGSPIRNGDIAKYAYDLRGGVSHICAYINGVTEQMIVGDKLASLLQIVAVSGKPGDVIEKKYDSPLFSKVVARNVDEIEIEIRTLEGRLVPFDYGVVILTLIFKKLIVF